VPVIKRVAGVEELINKIKHRLSEGAYPNEASVSIGIVTPILRALGWDDSDPNQVIPEYASGGRRVDFAICAINRRPSLFIEVKGVGRALEGEKQLFEYAFHEGIPLCLLTDGRDWSFFLPGAQGSYDDRRVYRLQIDQRPAVECVSILERYLSRARIKSGDAVEDAMRDYRNKASRREAKRNIPQAWQKLVGEPEDLLLELLSEQTERLSGFRPTTAELTEFLKGLQSGMPLAQPTSASNTFFEPNVKVFTKAVAKLDKVSALGSMRSISYVLFGSSKSAPNAKDALIDILSEIAKRHPDKMSKVADAVKTRSRNHIAQSAAEIYPARPDLARAAEIGIGWLVGLNIANREKMRIIKTACDATGIEFGQDIAIEMPNAET
jgi:predicted type IV restriction endonuclease